MIQQARELLRQSAVFYPEYLVAHSSPANRVLHFIGATGFYVLVILAVVLQQWWLLPIAIFTGYLLPGIGHRFLQHNHSFRGTKPVLCVLCATRLYIDTVTLQAGRKLRAAQQAQ